MLDELIVSNLGLIDDAHLEPGPGLVVVTGETGAGKTMLLGALRLLMGSPGRKDLVGPSGDEATVQARFVLDGAEVMVARRLSRNGRSKAYLDGIMAPLRELESHTGAAVELVAQHDHLRLTTSAEVRSMIDAELDADGRSAHEAYAAAWKRLASLQRRQLELGGDRRALERQLETARFQLRDIESAAFQPGEDEALEAKVSRLRNAHAIVEALDVASQHLGEHHAEASIDQAAVALAKAANLDPLLEELAAQAADLGSLLGELRTAVTSAAEEISAEPAELQDVEARVALLGELRRKYGATLDDVLTFAAEAAGRIDGLSGMLHEADSLDDDLAVANAAVVVAGASLTDARRRTAERIAATALEHLRELGFDRPVLEFDITAATPGPNGTDRAELRFASDDQLEPGPVSRIASGGELSRLVLALRLATTASDASVAAFDEIDAGVGGAIALALGRKLARLATQRQVVCVTHLPQIAAHADTHYVIRRSGSKAVVERLEGESRVEELARMLAGMPKSERGREHAAELLAAAGQKG